MIMAKNKAEEEKKKQEPAITKSFPFHKLLSHADMVDWILMMLGTIGAIIHGMAQPIGYLCLGKALDAFGNNINDNKAMVNALYKVIPFVWYMAISTFPAGILEIGCWMYTSERQVVRLRLLFLRAVLSQEIGAFDTDLTTGKIIAGITNHMSVIQDAIGEKLGHFLSCVSTFFVGIVVAFICCWQVALLTLLVVPLITVIGAIYSKKMNSISTIKLDYLSEATSMVEQTISQIKTVFAYVGESTALKSFSKCMEKQFKLSRKEAMIKGFGLGLFQSVTYCSWALMVWVGAVVVSAGKSSGGDTLAAVMSILFGSISLTYAAPDLQIFNQARAAGNEVYGVTGREPRISYQTVGKISEKVRGDIDICDAYFAYPSRAEKMILRGFSLSVPAGKVVALVGSSGCGKSTVISLLQRFYDPSKGEILIDQHNIKELDLKFLRNNIGVVSQEPSLFSGTIKDNLLIGNPNASDKLTKAAVTANAHYFISQLPHQYETEVGERGLQLSGGQKQRIAIARAVLKDPPILLLDEATSALDSESEKLVQNALERVMQGRTVILIAHRLSTVVNADMIAVVENGMVTETGTHTELLESSKFYHKLFNMQNITTGNDTRCRDAAEDITAGSNEDYLSSREFSEQSIGMRSPPKEEKEDKNRREAVSLSRIWFGLSKFEMGKSVLGSAAAALSGISKPLFGFFIMTIGVAYYRHDAKRVVGWYSLVFTVAGLLTLLTHTLQHYFYGVVGETAMRNLRLALYSADFDAYTSMAGSKKGIVGKVIQRSVLRNELGWFEKPDNSVGFVTSRILNDTSMVKTIISDRISVIVQCISSILIATVVSIIVNWRMALVAWAVMPCHFIGGLIQASSAKGFSADPSTSHHDLISLTSEATSNIRTVASFSLQDQILHKANLSLQTPLRKTKIQSIKYGIMQGLSVFLWNTAHAIALWYTTVLVEKNQATFENGIRSYQIFSLTVPSITELWTLIPTVVSAIRILTPAFETLDRRTEIDPDSPPAKSLKRIKGRIEFENVGFRYPSRPEVSILHGFSLSVNQGTRVALVGPSGAGKSSVLALILRFYDPQHGRAMIDGKGIQEFNLRWLRTQIGFVQQEPLLFSCSIRDNICYGNESASESEVVEVSTEANIHDFVSSLPNGYDTVVGEKGCQLSGGQKQRVAIARMLLKRPAIVLLDEATSALDGESETAVMKALGSMREERESGVLARSTQVTVAHRLSTVMNSDSIVVMDNGEVVEMGDHATLIAASEGVYAKLFHLQNLSSS